MQEVSKFDGWIAYDFDEFCRDYGHPTGRLFTLEVTHDAVTYIYTEMIGTIRGNEVIFDLSDEDVVIARKAH